MKDATVKYCRSLLFISVIVVLSGAACGSALAAGDAKRGLYLTRIANCVGCHTREHERAVPYAGGRVLKTPFGIFYGPNITSDPDAGLGRWSEADFIRAMRFGLRPDGAPYFPSFPYPSFTKITDDDLRDIWAYLRTVKPDKRVSQEHELGFLFQWRFPVRIWKWMFFKPGPFVQDPGRTEALNRGAYIVQALGHCGECHTQRNLLGAPKKDRYLAGGMSPEDKKVPNITPTRLKKWSNQELKDFLTTGILPDGDVVGKTMGDVIENATRRLTAYDLNALVAYLRSLPPLENELENQ